MGKAWENENEAEVSATPEQVWQAIATGPGIDSWYMGRTTVDGTTVRTDVGAFVIESTITHDEPSKRFVQRSPDSPEGRFLAYEFLIEGRDQGSTVLRMVASGFLPGDDWESEYDAMLKGGAMYFQTLIAYLNHFAGRFAPPVATTVPHDLEWSSLTVMLGRAMGLDHAPAEGDRVLFTPTGLATVDGVVDFVNEATFGIRTQDGLYRFIDGFHGPMFVQHHLFQPGIDPRQTGRLWHDWLSQVIGV